MGERLWGGNKAACYAILLQAERWWAALQHRRNQNGPPHSSHPPPHRTLLRRRSAPGPASTLADSDGLSAMLALLLRTRIREDPTSCTLPAAGRRRVHRPIGRALAAGSGGGSGWRTRGCGSPRSPRRRQTRALVCISCLCDAGRTHSVWHSPGGKRGQYSSRASLKGSACLQRRSRICRLHSFNYCRNSGRLRGA